MKREYKKPSVEIIEMEVQQMICQSDITYSLKRKGEGEDLEEYIGEFE